MRERPYSYQSKSSIIAWLSYRHGNISHDTKLTYTKYTLGFEPPIVTNDGEKVSVIWFSPVLYRGGKKRILQDTDEFNSR